MTTTNFISGQSTFQMGRVSTKVRCLFLSTLVNSVRGAGAQARSVCLPNPLRFNVFLMWMKISEKRWHTECKGVGCGSIASRTGSKT